MRAFEHPQTIRAATAPGGGQPAKAGAQLMSVAQNGHIRAAGAREMGRTGFEPVTDGLKVRCSTG